MRGFLAGCLLLLAASVEAQIGYKPAASGGSFTTPGQGVIVDTDGAGTLAGRTITAGTGMLCVNGDGAAGNPTCSIDSSVVPQFTQSAAAAAGTSTVGFQHFNTTTPGFYVWPTTAAPYFVLTTPLTGLAQGDIFYLSGAATLSRLGAGTSGQFLQTLGTGANPQWADGGAFAPSTTLELYEDFVNEGSSAIATRYRVVLIGTGTSTVGDPTAVNPGVYKLRSHATNDNSGALISFGSPNTSKAIFTDLLTSKDWDFDAVVIPGNTGALANSAIYVGLAPQPNADPDGLSAGIVIKYDVDDSDTTYIFVVCNATGAAGCSASADNTNIKVAASSIAPSGTVPNRFRIRRRQSGVGGNPTIYMSVGASGAMEAEKTFCSSGCDDTLDTVPSVDMVPYVAYMTRTTTEVKGAAVDYMYFSMSGLARY